MSQTHANTNVNTNANTNVSINANTSTNTNAGHDSVLKMPGTRVISYCCASPRRPVPLTLPSVRDGKRPVGGFPSEPLTITMHQPRPRCLKIQEGAASDGGLIRTRESRNACVPPPPTHPCMRVRALVTVRCVQPLPLDLTAASNAVCCDNICEKPTGFPSLSL